MAGRSRSRAAAPAPRRASTGSARPRGSRNSTPSRFGSRDTSAARPDAIEPDSVSTIEPEAMALVVALQRAANERHHLLERHVLRDGRRWRRLPPEIPQQPLLGDALGDPRQHALLHPADPRRGSSALARRARAAAPPRRGAWPENDAAASRGAREAGNRLGSASLTVLAVQLVPVRTDRNDEDVHHVDDSKFSWGGERFVFRPGLRFPDPK